MYKSYLLNLFNRLSFSIAWYIEEYIVVPHDMEQKSKEYENKMLRPGFEPGISDSKGRYA
jgi:hypothetical protein